MWSFLVEHYTIKTDIIRYYLIIIMIKLYCIKTLLPKKSSHVLMAKELDSDLDVSKFEFQLCDYVHV